MRINTNVKRVFTLRTILQYIFLYLFLICHDAAIYRENTMPIRMAIIVVCIIAIFGMRRINKGFLMFLGCVTAYILFRGGVRSTMNLVEHILIIYVAINIDKDNFCERFVRICFFFAVISLPIYLLGLLKPDILLKIFDKEINVGWAYYGIPYNMRGRLFYTVRRMELYRNNSIFTEPGIYQMLLNSSLFMLLMMRDKLLHFTNKKITLYAFVFSLTTLTTGSTTAFLALFMIYAVYILNLQTIKRMDEDPKATTKIARKITFIGVITVIILLINYIISKQESILNTYVFQKILEMFSNGTSGHARTSMIKICMDLALTHFFGAGEAFVASTIKYLDEGANGAILVHSFASFGILPVLIILSYYFKDLFKKYVPVLGAALIIGLYLNTALAQSRLLYPSLIMLPIVYSDYCRKKYMMARADT